MLTETSDGLDVSHADKCDEFFIVQPNANGHNTPFLIEPFTVQAVTETQIMAVSKTHIHQVIHYKKDPIKYGVLPDSPVLKEAQELNRFHQAQSDMQHWVPRYHETVFCITNGKVTEHIIASGLSMRDALDLQNDHNLFRTRQAAKAQLAAMDVSQ